MNSRPRLSAFSGYGIELEYAVVDANSLDTRPMGGHLLTLRGESSSKAGDARDLSWSHELAAHVVELKNVTPTAPLDMLSMGFRLEVEAANNVLARSDLRLMPTGMHPWMDPRTETVLWNGDDKPIYEAYDRLFDCARHGWANIQSMHINLPFGDDGEFARLHAATRVMLPLLPALAASSPIADGRETGFLDYRLECYRTNSARFPSITADVIPESIADRKQYAQRILEPMYAEVTAYDPSGMLQHEWLNARGAIARFDRDALEIRLADTQECPEMDLAIAEAFIVVVRALYDERCNSFGAQQGIDTGVLSRVFQSCIRDAGEALVQDTEYLQVLGLSPKAHSAAAVWAELLEAFGPANSWWRNSVNMLLSEGTLARRILRAVGGDFRREHLRAIYGELCACLHESRRFGA